MKTLSHGQLVYGELWGNFHSSKVFTIQGYAKETNRSEQEMLDRAIKNNHELVATINPGTVLTNSEGYYERENQLRQNSVPLNEGELIQAEGKIYKVKLVGKNYSDPIHFIPQH